MLDKIPFFLLSRTADAMPGSPQTKKSGAPDPIGADPRLGRGEHEVLGHRPVHVTGHGAERGERGKDSELDNIETLTRYCKKRNCCTHIQPKYILFT